MEVFNVQGQKLLGRELRLQAQQVQSEIIPAQEWPEGLYFLRLWTSDGAVLSRKLIKVSQP
jgi:hypothetical protein